MLSFQGSLERHARGFGRASRDLAHSHKAGLQDRFLQVQWYGRSLGLSAAERSGATCGAGPSIAALGIVMSVKELADCSRHATSGLALRATWCRSGTPRL